MTGPKNLLADHDGMHPLSGTNNVTVIAKFANSKGIGMSFPSFSAPSLNIALQQNFSQIEKISEQINQFSEDVRKLESYFVDKGLCAPFRVEVTAARGGMLFQPDERHFLVWQKQNDKEYKIFHQAVWAGGNHIELLANSKIEVRASLREELPKFVQGITQFFSNSGATNEEA